MAEQRDLRRQHGIGEGDGRKGQQRRPGGENGRHDEEDLVGPGRREVLFEHQLEHVRQGLQQTPGAHPVGAVAQLDETQDLPFQEDRIGHAGEQHTHHHGDFNQIQ